MNERITEDIVREHFKNEKKMYPNLIIEEQKSDNNRIQKALKGSSKSGDGIGRPEFLISGLQNNLLIIVECKGDINKHQSESEDNYAEYAVDGVKHYMNFLSKEFDVVGIAISGSRDYYRVSTFLIKKEEIEPKNLNKNELATIAWYNKENKYDYKVVLKSIEKIRFFIGELHNTFRDNFSLTQEQKPLLFSGILISLWSDDFRIGYEKAKNNLELVKSLCVHIDNVLSRDDDYGEKLDTNKIRLMMSQYDMLGTVGALKDDKRNDLLDVVREIDEKLYPYYRKKGDYQNNGHDSFGDIYREFLKYAANDKGLGIVLTPEHIAELFCEIPNTNGISYKDKVFDSCCGTGTFLIKAMEKMLNDGHISEIEKEKEIKRIKKERLFGIDFNVKMFTLACSNMFLKGDGKSNIYQGDCKIAIKRDIKDHKPTVCLINPPYAQKKEGYSELHFIKYALEGLTENGILVAIVPMSCAIKPSVIKEQLMKEHTLQAVMSMPNDLFYPVGVVACIMVWKAHSPHNRDVETWFGYWKNDGFIKDKVQGRIDGGGWKTIKTTWIDHWRNRREVLGMSVKAKVGSNDEWCAEAYMETNYLIISENDFDILLKDLVAWRIKHD